MCHVIPALSVTENVSREETLPDELKSADENGLEIAPFVSHWVMAASSLSLRGWEPIKKLLIPREGHMSR